MRRTSIVIEGFRHKNPIPNACVIDGILMSGVINGVDPGTGAVPPGMDEQCRHLFAHVRAILAAAGGTPEDILKMTVWLGDRADRTTLNREWLALFPDAASRPARHALQAAMEPPLLIQCDVTAVLAGRRSEVR